MVSRRRDQAHLEAHLREPRRSSLLPRTKAELLRTMIMRAHHRRHFSRRIRPLCHLLLRLLHLLQRHPPLHPRPRLPKKCRWWTWANWGSGCPQRYSLAASPTLTKRHAACGKPCLLRRGTDVAVPLTPTLNSSSPPPPRRLLPTAQTAGENSPGNSPGNRQRGKHPECQTRRLGGKCRCRYTRASERSASVSRVKWQCYRSLRFRASLRQRRGGSRARCLSNCTGPAAPAATHSLCEQHAACVNWEQNAYVFER